MDKIGKFSGKKQLERLRRQNVLLLAGQEIAAHATEDLGAFERTKATGDFLLHLGHSNIVLALVVGKGNEGICHEPKDLILEVPQAFKQIT